MDFINTRTQEDQADVLAQYLRDDLLHRAKNKDGSNLRKVLIGLAQEWTRFRNKANEVYEQYDPTNTTDLISEWESVVGIPDECFDNTGTIEERRTNVLLKLAGINATTEKQFENIANILGVTADISSGVDLATLPLTLPFILIDEAEAPFTIVVTLDSSLETEGLPLTLPFTLSEGVQEILECVFNKIKPANTQVIFRFV